MNNPPAIGGPPPEIHAIYGGADSDPNGLTRWQPDHGSKLLPQRIRYVSETPQHVRSFPQGHEPSIHLAQWGIHWRTPTLMAVLFLCGILFALGHHFYYDSLDGKTNTSRDSQEWAIRLGTAFAFLARASLAAAAAIAYKQYSWLRLRKRPTTIGGVDSIFAAITDLSALVDLDKLRQAKMCTLLAILIWCIPLSAIVPPAALTVIPVLHHSTLEERVPEISWAGLPWQSGGFGYWLDAGQDLYRMTTTTAYGMSVLPLAPLHSNYTYYLQFLAPALKCGSVRTDAQAAFNEILGGDWENTSGVLYAYNAQEPNSPNLTSSLGISDQNAFANELWIRVPDKNISCQTWNVSYTARIEFKNGAQSIIILQQDDIERFLPKSTSYEVALGQDPPDAFGYKSWLETIASLLKGSLGVAGPKGVPQINNTQVLNTGLVGCPEMKPAVDLMPRYVTLVYDYYCRNGTLETAIEDLSRNVTLSLFGHAPGLRPSNETTPHPITTAFTANVYTYSHMTLLYSYAAGIAITLLPLLFGIHALIANGVVHNSDFSGVICATRNPDLDEVARGSCLAAKPVRKVVREVKVQFGVLGMGRGKEGGRNMDPGVERVGHAAFGMEGTVRKIRKRERLL